MHADPASDLPGDANGDGVTDECTGKLVLWEPPAITLEDTEAFPNTSGIVDFAIGVHPAILYDRRDADLVRRALEAGGVHVAQIGDVDVVSRSQVSHQAGATVPESRDRDRDAISGREDSPPRGGDGRLRRPDRHRRPGGGPYCAQKTDLR